MVRLSHHLKYSCIPKSTVHRWSTINLLCNSFLHIFQWSYCLVRIWSDFHIVSSARPVIRQPCQSHEKFRNFFVELNMASFRIEFGLIHIFIVLQILEQCSDLWQRRVGRKFSYIFSCSYNNISEGHCFLSKDVIWLHFWHCFWSFFDDWNRNKMVWIRASSNKKRDNVFLFFSRYKQCINCTRKNQFSHQRRCLDQSMALVYKYQ